MHKRGALFKLDLDRHLGTVISLKTLSLKTQESKTFRYLIDIPAWAAPVKFTCLHIRIPLIRSQTDRRTALIYQYSH